MGFMVILFSMIKKLTQEDKPMDKEIREKIALKRYQLISPGLRTNTSGSRLRPSTSSPAMVSRRSVFPR
jgi:hypothetical protein